MDEIRNIITEIEQLAKNGFPDDSLIEKRLRECFEKNDNFGILKYYLILHLKYPKELMYIRQTASFASKVKSYDLAIEFYNKSLKIEAWDFVAHNNLGLIYEDMGDFEQAKNHYLKSLEVKNNYFSNHNLGVILRNEHKYDESIKYLEQAIKIAPNEKEYKNSIYSLALTYFTKKDFQNGYPYFTEADIRPFVPTPRWKGEKSGEKTLLAYCQCGYGDYLQFCRYFKDLIPLFNKVKAYVPDELKSLFKRSFPQIEFYSKGVPVHDVSLFIMDAPYYLKEDFEHIPYKNGYLKADEEKIKLFKEKFFDTPDKKIGICWSGGSLASRNLKNRRIALKTFLPLTKIANTKFYIVQKDDTFNEAGECPEFVNLAPYLGSFDDTAAILKNLDLLISIDSSPVHLAGALGVKTRLILPYTSDWRWFENTENCDWYDSVKIFKLSHENNIDEIMKKIEDEIKS